MTPNIQAIRGMNDILPAETGLWQRLEDVVRDVLTSYGYSEIRLPVLEKTDLFSRSIGEVTDIVEKEMYTFLDRNGDSLTLRPEATAGCVRACMEHGLLHNQVRRLWYGGPMFRHERPQKGRYRQFHQIGAEAYGMEGPDIDVELICATARIWRRLGIEDVTLQINSLGSSASRGAYRQRLVGYFESRHAELDQDSRRRLGSNPLRILDSKNPDMVDVVAGAPSLLDYLDEESNCHFNRLKESLDALGLSYQVNPSLVRGLDYYCKTVFEWVTDRLGAQGTVCAGGRYDGLVEQLGGRPTPAVGFAMGLERLVALLADGNYQGRDQAPHAYLAMMGDAARTIGLLLAEALRNGIPGLRLQVDCVGGGFKAQLKRADRSGARLALIIGDEELATASVTIKPLRERVDQLTVSQENLASQLSQRLDLAV